MRSRTRSVLVMAGKSLALGTVFVSAAAWSVVLHADAKATRRLVAAVANDALASSFQGRLAIGDATHLSLGRTAHVRVSEVEVFDPEGRRIVFAKGIDAKVDLVRLVRSIAAGKAPDIALLDETRIEDVDVVVDRDANGELGLARAFAARPSPTPEPPAPPRAPNAEDLRLAMPRARIVHAWVHGNVVPPALDADIADLRGRLTLVDNRLTIDEESAQITVRAPRAPSQTGPVRGMLTGSLLVPLGSSAGAAAPSTLPGAARPGIVMRWDIDGDAAGVPLKAHFGLDGDKLDATADIAQVEPDVLRRALPLAPVTAPIEIHAKATGTLAHLALSAHGKVGEGTFASHGQLDLGEGQPFQIDAELSRIDAAAVGGPRSDVTARVHAEGRLGDGAPKGTFTVATKDSSVSAQQLPAVTADGTFDEHAVKASFRALEPGVSADGTIELRIAEQKLAFDVNARASDLAALARAPGLVAGSATAHATGTLDLGRNTIDAHVTADGRGLARAPASAGHAHAEATVSGPLGEPVIDVTARARDVTLAAAPSAEPGAEPKEPLRYPSATARARIVLSKAPTVQDVLVHVDGAGGGAAIDARAREIALTPGGVEIRGGRLTGLGAPLDFDVQTRAGALSVRAKGRDLDMVRLASMTGVEELRLLPEGSRAALDVDITAGRGRTDGHVVVVISGARDGSSAALHAKLDGRHVSARARVAVGAVGWVEVQRAELELPGELSLATLKRATGALDVRSEIDLAQGAALLGGESIEQISGTAMVSARIERGDANNLPTVYATAITHALDVTLAKDGTSTRISGVDGSVHVGYDSATDETEVSALTWDAVGIVASADAKARVPLIAWATGATPFDRKTVGALEVAAVADVPRRELSELPSMLARPAMLGTVSAHADLAGWVDRPSVTFVAHADDLGGKKADGGGPRFAPMDGVLEGRWDGDGVVASLRIDERERPARERDPSRPERAAPAGRAPRAARTAERKSGHARGLFIGALPVADLIAGRPLAWTAAGEVDVTDLELAPLPLPMNIRGALTGHVKLREIDGLPVLAGQAHVTDLVVGGARVMRGELKVDAKDGALAARATVRQDDGGGGEVKVVSSSLHWRGPNMTWDATQPTRVDYRVDSMQISILRPFVRRFIPEIEGILNGRGSAVVDATSQVFDGGLALSDGRLYVNAMGEEITRVNANATFERGGGFRVQDVRGTIGSAEIKASASGRFKGLRFESAEMVAVVPTKDGVPLSAEGATFAEATGELRLSAKMAPDRKALLVTVEVPRSKITLPDRGTQDLQPLSPDETIDVGIRRPNGALEPEALRPGARRRRDAATAAEEEGTADDSLPARLTVSLGDDVSLEGRGLRLHLGGRTVVDIADEVALTGQITLREGGTIDVQGRKFLVDRGTVSFVEGDEPSNPIVIAAAYWDAPDHTRVWVEFSGPLKTGKLTLRSEPPYSKNEILSVLLFGRADPNQGAAGEARPSDAQAATAVGTGIASSGLNRALSELDEDFDLEQDRTGANRVRTKLGYRLRRNLKVQLGYASGFSQREPDTTYLFVEWQFVPKWSLIGTRGDRGTSILDLLFQHRY
jgi:translocation and assembly module TamB